MLHVRIWESSSRLADVQTHFQVCTHPHRHHLRGHAVDSVIRQKRVKLALLLDILQELTDFVIGHFRIKFSGHAFMVLWRREQQRP